MNLLEKTFYSRNFKLAELALNIKSILFPSFWNPLRKQGIKQMSVDQTIDYIIQHKASVARFGDGEIAIMAGTNGVGFQEQDKNLAQQLYSAFTCPIDNLLVGLPDQFSYVNNSVRKSRKFWMWFIEKHNGYLQTILSTGTIYGNATITRLYIPLKSKHLAKNRFERLKNIWKNNDLLIIEGSLSRSGIGNDLFDNTKSIERIICPAKNAFTKYQVILEEIIKHGSNKLILLALGPTATVLAYDLAKAGYWAIDLGHLDVEYMWMKKKAKKKEQIVGRLINESNLTNVQELGKDDLEQYNRQVISKIN